MVLNKKQAANIYTETGKKGDNHSRKEKYIIQTKVYTYFSL